jgi:cell division septation protein DedD
VWGSNDLKIMVGCDWITDFNVETRRSNWCNRQTSEIAEHCAAACNHCGCQDSSYFKFEVFAQGGGTENVGCEWLTEAGISYAQATRRSTKWCEGTNSNVSTYCPVSCRRCVVVNAACEDNPEYTFNVFNNEGGGTKPVGCDWIQEDGISDNQLNNRYNRWCEGSPLTAQNCPVSCNVCSLDTNDRSRGEIDGDFESTDDGSSGGGADGSSGGGADGDFESTDDGSSGGAAAGGSTKAKKTSSPTSSPAPSIPKKTKSPPSPKGSTNTKAPSPPKESSSSKNKAPSKNQNGVVEDIALSSSSNTNVIVEDAGNNNILFIVAPAGFCAVVAFALGFFVYRKTKKGSRCTGDDEEVGFPIVEL